MCKFAIVTDSCCDLPAGLAREMDLSVINLSVRVEDQTFVNHLDWREVSAGDFYGLLRAQKSSSTSGRPWGTICRAWSRCWSRAGTCWCSAFPLP